MNKQTRLLIMGFALVVISLIQLFILKQAHFYSLFSIGLFIILLITFNNISRIRLFNKWKFKHHFLFWLAVILSGIIIDRIGLYLGYWIYPHYSGFFDEALKYSFEYAIALVYIMITLLIGFEIFKKFEITKKFSQILSFIVFVTLMGIVTESLNLQVDSWQVLSMPFSNYKIGDFFVVWQTIGFWLMALIPFIIYKLVDKIRRGKHDK